MPVRTLWSDRREALLQKAQNYHPNFNGFSLGLLVAGIGIALVVPWIGALLLVFGAIGFFAALGLKGRG
jgi:hypothetical protein